MEDPVNTPLTPPRRNGEVQEEEPKSITILRHCQAFRRSLRLSDFALNHYGCQETLLHFDHLGFCTINCY